jgi:eukaryotic-like serine/threonine-protein kinase
MPQGAQNIFRGTERFEVVRLIGAGGMGMVYEARDRERGMPVAVKTLPGADASGLLRFKNEFRAIADVVHPNLVTLYELFADGDQWFFTMELVHGVNFLEFARGIGAGAGPSNADTPTMLPTAARSVSETQSSATLPAPAANVAAPGTFDPQRLERTLPQLGAALAALHSAGKLHCDIKPANVLVTPEGRVVVLDFGVALSLHGEARIARYATGGTIAYMAPEQASGEPLGPAADSYAVGVMVFEAVTGRRPFSGDALGIMREKQTVAPPALSSIVPTVSPELSDLCGRLLDRNADRRPLARELARPGQRAAVAAARRPDEAPADVLVGRERHLALLQEAYERVEGQQTAIVAVRAPSGMGKSLLIAHFLKSVAARPDAVVISGRCYENEFVPYKAVDSLMDGLSRLLDSERSLIADAAIPADAGVLAQIFPVLRPVVGSASAAIAPAGSVHELRRRAFSVLRGLLTHVGRSRVLVLHVDDLHWGDVDSATLLAHLLREPDPPRLLFITSYRSDDAANNRCLQMLMQEPAFAKATVLELGALGHDDSIALAGELLEYRGHPDAAAAEAIAAESRGNPYFIRELVERHARTGAGMTPQDGTTLDGVLRSRIEALPEDSQRLLELVAVSGQPLRETDAFAAAGLAARDPAVLATLRKTHLVRTATRGDAVYVDTYHDRIRETLVV